MRETSLTRVPGQYGNLVESTFTARRDSSHSIEERRNVDIQYEARPDQWQLDLPSTVRETHTLRGESENHRTDYQYYSNGLVREVTRELDSNGTLRTVFERDSNDLNPIAISVDDPRSNEERRSTFVYDSSGRYPMFVTNALGQVTELEYDHRTGQLLSAMDPNGVVTQWVYDPMGHLAKVVLPTHEVEVTRVRSDFRPGGAIGTISAAYEETVTDSRFGERVTSYDAYGNVVEQRSTTMGSTGDPTPGEVIQEFVYDNAGRLERAAVPHPAGDDTRGYTEFFRDEIGRVIRTELPDGRQVQTSYATYLTRAASLAGLLQNTGDGLASDAVLVTQPNGRVDITGTDFLGDTRVAGSWDPELASTIDDELEGDGLAFSRFEYGAYHRLRTSIDPDGESRTVEYDGIGRRTLLQSSSGEYQQTGYNAFDEPTYFENANGERSCTDFDALGRPKEVLRTDSQTCDPLGDVIERWTYDGNGTRPNEIGKLVEDYRESEPGSGVGTIRQYRYQAPPGSGLNVGQLERVLQHVPGLAYPLETSFEYDGPLVDTVHYPSADSTDFAVSYGYDSAGNAISARVAGSGGLDTTVWEATDVDAGGERVTRERFGNGVETGYEYYYSGQDYAECQWGALTFCPHGGLRSQDTRESGEADAKMALEYRYDVMDNVWIRFNDYGSEQSRDGYLYDKFERLTTFSSYADRQAEDLIRRQTWSYSAGGKILETSVESPGSAGTTKAYTYDPGNVHLLLEAGGLGYEYDAMGNVSRRTGAEVPGGIQTFTHNEFDMPRAITSGALGTTKLEYTASHERVAKRGPEGGETTLYAGEVYECKGTTPSGNTPMSCEEQKYKVYVGDAEVAQFTRGAIGELTEQSYIHRDHLGSSALVTNERGETTSVRRYEPFGKPMEALARACQGERCADGARAEPARRPRKNRMVVPIPVAALQERIAHMTPAP